MTTTTTRSACFWAGTSVMHQDGTGFAEPVANTLCTATSSGVYRSAHSNVKLGLQAQACALETQLDAPGFLGPAYAGLACLGCHTKASSVQHACTEWAAPNRDVGVKDLVCVRSGVMPAAAHKPLSKGSQQWWLPSVSPTPQELARMNMPSAILARVLGGQQHILLVYGYTLLCQMIELPTTCHDLHWPVQDAG